MALTLLVGCCQGKGQQAGASQEIKVLRMGLIPAEDSQKMLESYKPLIAHLEKKIGIKIEPFAATDYSGVIEAMRSGKVDFAWFGPFSYILAAEKANAEAFAVEVREGTGAYYKSIIVAHRDSGIKTLEDIKGKDFAFVDPASTSGNLFPRAQFKKLGIDPEKDFKSVVYAGGHDAAELAVKNKKVHAAADDDITYNLMVKQGLISPDEIKIIWESEPIPGSPLAYRKDLPEEIKKKIKDAVINVHKEDPAAMGGIGKVLRYDETNDANYNVIREVARVLNLDLSKKK
ncbi:MAG: phosphonate ABC transporter substrate-binding protein [Firmicutes bacterium]|nr:phosphonate ABC transporter substrate-binding protein [Bacillota bacterium]